MNELALFAGAGGGILGGKILGWRCVCAVEIEPYCRAVLCQRQNDGILSPFPIWDDVRTFDGKPWKGIIDVVSGGFPCQDISIAGKGDGISGKRSGLWGEMARIISEVQPRFAYIENSPLLISRGLETVLCDLAKMGYDARWGIVSAENAKAIHQRKRIWILSYPMRNRLQGRWKDGDVSGQVGLCSREGENKNEGLRKARNYWEVEPDVGRVVNGLASRVDRLKAIGNGQVPQAMALAWNILIGKDQNGLPSEKEKGKEGKH